MLQVVSIESVRNVAYSWLEDDAQVKAFLHDIDIEEASRKLFGEV